MIDCDAILYSFLTTSGTDLYTLVGTRVEFGQTPDGFANTQNQIVFLPEDGDPDTDAPMREVSFLFHCYGGSNRWADAKTVYKTLCGRIHGLNMRTVTGLGVIMAMHEQGTGRPLTHPGTKHKLMQCRFVGKFKEI